MVDKHVPLNKKMVRGNHAPITSKDLRKASHPSTQEVD